MPGGYGEYFITKADKLLVLPKEYPLANAALIEPLAVSLRGMKRIRIENRETARSKQGDAIKVVIEWLPEKSKR